jgi:hypothetical protein
MPKVAELQAASIYTYADDHNPPLFNVRGPDSDANFYIHTCEMYVGEVTRKAMREVGDWWSVPENRKLLEDKWKEYNERD